MQKIGQVFTPYTWARWCVDSCSIYQDWLDGASVCDPTGGEGVFIQVLLDKAAQERKLSSVLVARLAYLEKDIDCVQKFSRTLQEKYPQYATSLQICHRDVIVHDLLDMAHQYDWLIGNPPWVNFTDLDDAYKADIKEHFVSEGLVVSKRNTLLGNTRIDIAALVLQKVLGVLTKPCAKCAFFVPSSLWYGDAHAEFRNCHTRGRDFRVVQFVELEKVFVDVQTKYGCVYLKMDTKNEYPISIHTTVNAEQMWAFPIPHPNGMWMIQKNREYDTIPQITIHKSQTPRQGVNTCGSNAVYFFDKYPEHLPAQYVYPLATKEIWKQEVVENQIDFEAGSSIVPCKWVLLPYNSDSGKVLTWNEITQYPHLERYLLQHKDTLVARKGTMLSGSLHRGYWWAMLGVGKYTFAPYKIMWQSYGVKQWKPLLFSSTSTRQIWIANQALQSYIPVWDKGEALRIVEEISHPCYEKFLSSLQGASTANWAQPGKVKHFLRILDI